jgi:RNA polymerase sigma-70 factor (ECF subfamily)
LPVFQKKAIEIVYLHEVTHEDAAREFDIPLGTFKSRLRLGLIKLRELLKEK